MLCRCFGCVPVDSAVDEPCINVEHDSYGCTGCHLEGWVSVRAVICMRNGQYIGTFNNG